MQTATQIFKAAFEKPRTPRSTPYRAGALMCLKAHEEAIQARASVWQFVNDRMATACPHKAGTPSFDAFFAGSQEGTALFKIAQEDHARAMRDTRYSTTGA